MTMQPNHMTAALDLVSLVAQKTPMDPATVQSLIVDVYAAIVKISEMDQSSSTALSTPVAVASASPIAPAAAAPVAAAPAEVAAQPPVALSDDPAAVRRSLLPPPTSPAIDPKAAIDGEYIYCLEDGTRHKMMKRHLWNKFGLTPEMYRERWNLPSDYPVVAPGYSAAKRAEAKHTGLGHSPHRRGAKAGKKQNVAA